MEENKVVAELDGLSVPGLVRVKIDSRGAYYAVCSWGLIRFQSGAGRAWIKSVIDGLALAENLGVEDDLGGEEGWF